MKKLFNEVSIPEAVKKEVMFAGRNSFGYKEVNNETWIKEIKIRNKSAKSYLKTDLDDGEAEVIILAEEVESDLIIMDDRLGRKIAKLRGYKVIGTLSLLVIAKEKGIISDVKSRFNKLISVGFWINDDVCNSLLKQANEL